MRKKIFQAFKTTLNSGRKDQVKEPLIFSSEVKAENFLLHNGDFLIRESKTYHGLLSVSFMDEGVIKNKRFGLKDNVWEKCPGDDKGKQAQKAFFDDVSSKFDKKNITEKELSSLGNILIQDGFTQDRLVKPNNENASTNYLAFTADSVYEKSPSVEKGFTSLP